jgi:DNA-binding transcriptional MerR regulator
MAERESGWMTIEKLSEKSGVTTRNIRAYQSRGLLPAPVTRAGERAAFYTLEHLARLRLVNRMQEQGYSLAGIANLVSAWAEGKNLDQVLGIESAIAESEEDQSVLVSGEELEGLLPKDVDRETAIGRLTALGLIDRHEKGYRLRFPHVLRLGADAMEAGIPFDALLDEFVRMQADLHAIGLRFVALFITHVLAPFTEAGMPKEKLPLIVERMKRLRQLAGEATHALMRQAMADEIEAAARTRLPLPPEGG